MGLTRSSADRPGRSSPLRHPIFTPSRTVERPTQPSFAKALRTPTFSATIAHGNAAKVHSNAIAVFPIDATPPALPPPATQEGRPPFRTTGLPKPIYRTIESLSATPIPRSKALASGTATLRPADGFIRRRTWPSGAPGDRNARWRPSRCARTARRRAPGTRGSDGCSGPRS